MFLHPSNILFMLTMILSILTIISTHSWLMVWIALEVNMMAFTPMIIKKKNKYQTEAALKYFLVQTVASALILMSMFYLSIKKKSCTALMLSALMLKMAGAPFHQWLPSMVMGLSWKSLSLLLMPQKMGPLVILMNNSLNNLTEKMMLMFITMSAMVGSITGLSQSSLRKILSYSSITHLSWTLAALMYSKPMWMIYFMLYMLMLIPVIMSFIYTNMNYIKHIYTNNTFILSFTMTLLLLSLAGLPPFSGFFPKLMIIIMIYNTSYKILLIPLILSTLISLYFYMRMAINAIFLSSSKNMMNKFYFNKTTMTIINTMAFTFTPLLFMMMLVFKLYKL